MIVRRALSWIAALLAIVVLVEWAVPTSDSRQQVVSLGLAATASRDGMPMAALGAEALAGKILARPLFLAGRHLPAPVVAAPVAQSVKETPLPRLTGILLMSGTRLAVFQVDGQIKPVTVAVGDPISAWTVTAIDPEAVTIAGAKGKQTLAPSADPNAASIPDPTGDVPVGPNQ